MSKIINILFFQEALIKIQGSAIRAGGNTIKIESTAVIAHSCLGHVSLYKTLFSKFTHRHHYMPSNIYKR